MAHYPIVYMQIIVEGEEMNNISGQTSLREKKYNEYNKIIISHNNLLLNL